MKQKLVYLFTSIFVAAGLLVAAPAFAQTQTQPQGNAWGHPLASGMRGGMPHIPGVFGTVTAVSGDSISLSSKGFGKDATSTTAYTVDATNATVIKDGATSTVSAIDAGDMLMVQGTVSGTSVSATRIEDGIPKGMGMPGRDGFASSTMPRLHPVSIQGNGEPVVGGSVTAISGDTLTVTNKSNVTYTIDASGAAVVKGNATSSISAIVTGDNVLVQGAVNGNAVTASSIIDQGTPKGSGNENSNGNGMGAPMLHGFGGIFGAIGGLLQHFFGFF